MAADERRMRWTRSMRRVDGGADIAIEARDGDEGGVRREEEEPSAASDPVFLRVAVEGLDLA
jgi:hypothetical protein